MKIGITGANGFIGWHMRCYLHSLQDDIEEVRLADRKTFLSKNLLDSFCENLDIIVHLAGVNRASDDEIRNGNLKPAEQLIQSLINTRSTPIVVYSSTLHTIDAKSVYGQSKASVTRAFRAWEKKSKGRFIEVIIPHVFGEYGRPNYNSGVATFAHNIVHGIKSEINPNGELELIHVQDLVEKMIDICRYSENGQVILKGKKISVTDVYSKLYKYFNIYIKNYTIPNVKSAFDRRLFNTLRSFIPLNDRLMKIELKSDNRGWLVETVKVKSGGQSFVSSTHPKITRGNHYHRYKIERFFVLQGKAEIKIRKLFSNEVKTFIITGDKPTFIDIPTLYTHNITNVGEDELITMFWSDEIFDPKKPDTYYEVV